MPISIDKPSKYFNTVLYTGNGSTQSITGVGFKPDLVWLKQRSASTYFHRLQDAVRGAGKTIFSNSTNAEGDFGTGTDGSIRTFDTDGFSIGSEAGTNTNAVTHVAWNWLGANTTVSNTAGSITSTVSANTTSGFSIVSYTGNGTNGATVGHGLGAVPKIIIYKERSEARNWYVFTSVIDGSYDNLYLNLTDAKTDRTITLPTSSLFSLSTSNEHNASSQTYIAYCFAEVKGYSKFGSYTGNGSDDGTFVYTGFKPAFVLVKRTDSTGYWYLWDSARRTYNYNGSTLFPNDTSAESSYTPSNPVVDFLSNGFKLRGSYPEVNASGGTIIYMAFAENPFVSSKGIPTTAR